MQLNTKFIALLLPAAAFAKLNGPCARSWGPNCICLTKNGCHEYGGTSYTGYPGDYPCPSDGPSIMGCKVPNCLPGPNYHCAWMAGTNGVSGGCKVPFPGKQFHEIQYFCQMLETDYLTISRQGVPG